MDKLYSYVANSPVMFIFCALAILVVLVQAVIFFRTAWKRALEMGFTKGELMKVVKSSAIFSIVPSLPIIISYMILLPALGKFFPWLRLSVIGSATYETLAANMAVTSFGFDSLGSADFSPDVFGSLLWVVTLGVFLSSLSALLLRRFDTKMQSVTADTNSFGHAVRLLSGGCDQHPISSHHRGVRRDNDRPEQPWKKAPCTEGICIFFEHDRWHGFRLSGHGSDLIRRDCHEKRKQCRPAAQPF